jgi:hypothetical protein
MIEWRTNKTVRAFAQVVVYFVRCEHAQKNNYFCTNICYNIELENR